MTNILGNARFLQIRISDFGKPFEHKKRHTPHEAGCAGKAQKTIFKRLRHQSGNSAPLTA
ncbi:hypothetical protein INF35_11645 [Subdoligranulum sp. DSM 109015]|uniref:Uncharacterized protein n=1 Tax=Gemmiger gallinarum TaxID=2779354 RepID=A0ABR9R5M5_9FIRM|nr:hypothetical protein [Gemmiger gallinarum]